MKILIKASVFHRAEMNSENSNIQRNISSMPFVRYIVSYYRQNIRFLSMSGTSSRFAVAPQNQGFNLFDRTRYFSSNQNDGVETRDIDTSKLAKGSETPAPPSSGKLPFFNWTKWAIGSIFTLLLPFLYTQWKTILKIGGEVEMAKEAIEKTAEAVEKAAEITEKASKEAEEEFPKNEKLKKVADAVEHVSEIVEEEAHLVEDIIHKKVCKNKKQEKVNDACKKLSKLRVQFLQALVDEIEEDVKTMIDPISEHSKHQDENSPEEHSN